MVKKSFNSLEIALCSSMVSNICGIFYIQQQNKVINDLIAKNNLLVESINKLGKDLSVLENKITLMSSTSNPVYVNTGGSFITNNPLLFVCLATATLGISYYMSTLLVSKLFTLTSTNYVTFPKLISFSSYLSKLPFFEQTKEFTVLVNDLSVTLFIEMLGDKVLNIGFRHKDDIEYTPFTEALKFFLKARKDLSNSATGMEDDLVSEVSEVIEDEIITNIVTSAVEPISETISNLSGLF